MLRFLAKGLLGRLLGYALVGLGFWLLFRGFLESQYFLAAAGAALIPAGLYLLALLRRQEARQASLTGLADKEKEDRTGDLLNGRDESH